MSNQLKVLNTNIEAKNNKIKRTYKSMKKVRVYFQVQVYLKDQTGLDHLEIEEMVKVVNPYNSEELTYAKANKVMKAAIEEYDSRYIKQLVRIQTGGYVSGIILGGSREVIQNVAC